MQDHTGMTAGSRQAPVETPRVRNSYDRTD